jgi:Mg-chelatase subunit ChlD
MSPEKIKEDKERIEEAVMASIVGGYLPCSVALRLSAELNVESKMVGDTTNRLGVRITDCMLGCFKIKKSQHDDLDNKHFSQEIIEAIQSSLVGGRLPCKVAHDLGRKIKISLREIGDAATKMKIKIDHCQLGCFS